MMDKPFVDEDGKLQRGIPEMGIYLKEVQPVDAHPANGPKDGESTVGWFRRSVAFLELLGNPFKRKHD